MATLTYTTLGGITAGAPNTASDVTTAFTQAQAAINTIDTAQIAAAAVTDAKLAMLRGVINSNGTIAQGTGFTCSRTGTGAYTVTFTNAYSAAPVAFVGSSASTEFVPLVTASTTALTINLGTNVSGAAVDAKFNFLVIASS